MSTGGFKILGTITASAIYPLLFIICCVLKILQWTPLLFRWAFPLSEVPGPRLATWSRLWLAKTFFGGNTAEALTKVNLHYGPVARIGPNHILISDAEVTRRILAVGSSYTRGPWFDSLKVHPRRPNVVSERDPKEHQKRRNVLSHALTGKGFANMEVIMNGHVKDWVVMLEKNCDAVGFRCDFSRVVSFLTVDLLSHLCLGAPFGCVAAQDDKHRFLASVRWLVQSPSMERLIYPKPHDGSDIGSVMGFIRNAVDSAYTSVNVEEHEMIRSFIQRGLKREEAEDELLVVITAGETTSNALQGILLGIITNPHVYAKLQKEIDSRGHEPFPVPYDVAQQLPYLRACIFEGLRRYPPLYQLRERMVPPDGDVMHGMRIPGGTFVALNFIATQLDPVYGDDQDIYRPERWFIEDEKRLRDMHRTLDLVFSYGSTTCLGSNMAYMQIFKVIFELFRGFNLSLVDPFKPWSRVSRGILFQKDFNIRLERRFS